jgi:hypothetical protein
MKFTKLVEMMENVPEYLYHGTSVFQLVYILDSNELREGIHWDKPNEPHGPRLTKSSEVAKTFFSYATPDLGDESPGALLILSGPKLASKYELAEYTDTQYAGGTWESDEEEVVVLTPVVKPLSAFLERVEVARVHAEFALQDEILEFAISWPYLEVGTVEEARQLVQRALSHSFVTIT